MADFFMSFITNIEHVLDGNDIQKVILSLKIEIEIKIVVSRPQILKVDKKKIKNFCPKEEF